MKTVEADIAIIGAGIAGLWAFNRLRNLGYAAVLLESQAIGGGQTLHSQGIIHGGLKYALQGILQPAAQIISDMPTRWKNCLEGSGEINLSKVSLLSDAQYLWSTGSLTSDLASFFASKTLSSRVKKLHRTEFPSLFANPKFKGQVYRLSEVVLDTVSLVKALAEPYYQFIYKVDPDQGIQLQLQHDTANSLAGIQIYNEQAAVALKAKCYLFTAGEGNARLLKDLLNPPEMQLRPLHMVLVKLPKAFPIFAHCIEAGMNPRLTITSHFDQNGQLFWYLGGQLAEEGIERTQPTQCQVAQQELQNLFPWIDFSAGEFKSFFINRAEVKMPQGKRPDSYFLERQQNIFVAWPTKLALTPLLIDDLLAQLKSNQVNPSTQDLSALNDWPHPSLASPPWENAHFWPISL